MPNAFKPKGKRERRDRFVQEYLKDFNGRQAAIRAGYKVRSADSQACDLLRDPKVKEAIEKGKAAISARCDVEQEEIVRHWRRRMNANISDFYEHDETGKLVLDANGRPILNFTHSTRDQMACIQKHTEDFAGGSGDGERKLVLRTRIELCDPDNAALQLARYKGMLTDKSEVTAKVDLSQLSDEELDELIKKGRQR